MEPICGETQNLKGVKDYFEETKEGITQMIVGVHHHSIAVTNLDNSIRFYRDTLGMKLLFTGESKGDELSRGVGVKGASLKLAVLKAGNSTIELIQYVTPKGKPYDRLPCDVGSMHIGFKVSDVHKMFDDLTKKGVKFNTPPNEIKKGPMKGWIWTYFKDPDGAQLELVEER